jgi:uncharacterized protein YndB with AHSA1/START domain
MNVCPIATIHAPVERVWQLLVEPAHYALWWDAQTRSIDPAGSARAGQRIEAETIAFGLRWPVRIVVESVDPGRRQIQLTTQLPFGITVHNHIVCAALDRATCRVTFG